MPIECELMSVSPRQYETPGVPGAQALGHELRNAAVVVDRRSGTRRRSRPARSQSIAFAADGHAGVVQDQQRRLHAVASRLSVLGRMDRGNERAVGRERHWLGSSALSARCPRSTRMAS